MRTITIIANTWIKKYKNNYYGFPQVKFLEGFGNVFDKVYFLCPVFIEKGINKKNEVRLGKRITNKNIEIVELPAFGGTKDQVIKFYLLPYLSLKYLSYIKKADIVFVFTSDLFATIGLFLTKLVRKPVVFWIGEDWEKDVKFKYKTEIPVLGVKFLRWIQKKLLKIDKKKSMIFLTGAVNIKEKFENWNIKIYDYFASLIKKEDIFYRTELDFKNQNIINILYVGWLIEAKGVQDLIKAIPLIKTDKKIILHIVGDGYYRRYLEKLAKSLGIEVKFYGFIGDDEYLYKIYRKCDIFVLPSYSEGYPKVLFEAISQGLIPICSNVVELDFPIKYEVRNIKDLSEKIAELLNKDKKSLDKILDRLYSIVQAFTIDESIAKIYSILRREWINDRG